MEDSIVIRLLKGGKLFCIPRLVFVRNLISSLDVIHSWSVPSLGVKADAVPGRLNQVFLFRKNNCLVIGQCSEICGSNHSFMPIVLTFF